MECTISTLNKLNLRYSIHKFYYKSLHIWVIQLVRTFSLSIYMFQVLTTKLKHLENFSLEYSIERYIHSSRSETHSSNIIKKEDYSAWNTQWVQSRYFTAEVWTTSGIHLKIKAWKEKYLRLSIYIFQVLSTKKKLIL